MKRPGGLLYMELAPDKVGTAILLEPPYHMFTA